MSLKLSKRPLIFIILILFVFYNFFSTNSSSSISLRVITSKCDCNENIQIKIDQSKNSYIISIVKEIDKKVSKISTRSIPKSNKLTF